MPENKEVSLASLWNCQDFSVLEPAQDYWSFLSCGPALFRSPQLLVSLFSSFSILSDLNSADYGSQPFEILYSTFARRLHIKASPFCRVFWNILADLGCVFLPAVASFSLPNVLACCLWCGSLPHCCGHPYSLKHQLKGHQWCHLPRGPQIFPCLALSY